MVRDRDGEVAKRVPACTKKKKHDDIHTSGSFKTHDCTARYHGHTSMLGQDKTTMTDIEIDCYLA